MKKPGYALSLLAALGAFSIPVFAFRDQHGRIGRKRSKNSQRTGSGNRYNYHPGNGARECARRVRQLNLKEA